MFTVSGYHTLDPIYQGVDSTVFRAIRSEDGLKVIIKALTAEYPSPERVAEYLHEYRILQGLGLRGVINVYNLVMVEHCPAIILEDFGGTSLNILTESKTFTPSEVVRIAVPLISATAEIHAANLIHKDINPSNIVFNPYTGQLKVIDFGIAGVLSQENPETKNPALMEGTLPYISPEQTGRMNRPVDYRSDFYSLGCTLYELLAGKPPFNGNDAMDLVHCHMAQIPAPPHELNPRVPQVLSDIVLKLLSKNAEDRYQSHRGLLADLEEYLTRYERSGTVERFAIASTDISDRIHLPDRLYGRESHVKVLLEAFHRVGTGEKEIVWISGVPGIGKTSLVKEMHKPVTQGGGLFLSGKFDQLQRNMPYSAFIGAFRELVRQLLTKSPEELNRWREKLATALSPNVGVITEVIPEVELITGPQAPLQQLGPVESRNRFNFVFRSFVRVFCEREHPLVVFLDDLQWADSSSLDLLELIMTDVETSHLLLVGAYRSTEVGEGHRLLSTFEALREAGTGIGEIVPEALDPPQVMQLTADSLMSPQSHVEPLAWLTHEKTAGNPFFVREFLKSLAAERLVTMDTKAGAWKWDLDQIRALQITDNVVELLADRIQKLPGETADVLKPAACMGNTFDIRTLSAVCGRPQADVFSLLREALAEGLILATGDTRACLDLDVPASRPTTKVEFKFSHDRIQQAAYSLIPRGERQLFHLQVGRRLLETIPDEEKDARIFDIVNQFNAAVQVIDCQSEKHLSARMNLTAGKKAKASSAYDSAFEYLQTGIGLLGEDGWHDSYQLALELHTQAAEAAQLSGRFDEMKRLAGQVLAQAHELLDTVPIQEIKVRAAIAQGNPAQAMETALPVLAELGLKFPEKVSRLHLLAALVRTRLALAGKGKDHLINLRTMTDPYKLAAMRMVSMVGSAAYWVAPELVPLGALNMVTMSVRNGNASASPHAYAGYALILCAVLGDIAAGRKFAEAALELEERIDTGGLAARTRFTADPLLRHWHDHAAQALEPLREIHKKALDVGDLEYASHAAYLYCLTSYMIGSSLDSVQQEMARAIQVIDRLKQHKTLHITRIHHQAVLNLVSCPDDPCSLNGESYHEDSMLEVHLQANDRNALFNFYYTKLVLSFIFERYADAVDYARKAEPYMTGVLGSITVPSYHFYYSLALLAACSGAGRGECREYLAKTAALTKKLKKWARHAPMNYLHKYQLVEAERSRVLGHDRKAADLYERALKASRDHNYLNDESLAYELAAKFYLAKGKFSPARAYMEDAHYGYTRWGAESKARALTRRYGDLLSPRSISPHSIAGPTKTTTSRSVTVSGGDLDFAALIEASRAISGELVLEKLLDRLMRLVLRNAGARKAFLIMESQGKLRIAAEGSSDSDDVVLLQWTDIEQSANLCAAVIHYVARTKESVILNDATHEGPFTMERYVVDHKPKSLLCSPLIHQGKLTGIVYLENNLTTGAFTRGRVQVVSILCSQAAVSLETARLYEQLEDHSRMLEQRVAERTAELQKANENLINEIAEKERAELAAGRSEETARALLNATIDAAVLLDTDGRILESNNVFARGLGLDPSEIMGRVFFDLFPANVSELRKLRVKEVLRTRTSLRFVDDHTNMYFDNTVYPLCDGRGQVDRFAVFSRDITEQVRAERKLRKAMEAAEAASRTKSDFLANMSHELRTPLNAIIGFSELLADQSYGSVNEEQLSYVKMILNSGEHLLHLINEILDLAKIESCKMELRPSRVNIQQLLQKSLLIVQEKAIRHDLQVELCVAEGLKTAHLHADLVKLKQVLVNLLSNAFKFTPDGGTVTVKSWKQGDEIFVSVSDTGIGIKSEDLERVFEAFEQVDTSYGRKQAGTGLGLALTRSLVELHGGRIWAESEGQGKGSTFTFAIRANV